MTSAAGFLAGGILKLATAEPLADQWIYLHLDPLKHSWSRFSWQFDVRRITAFRELQFGLRYVDFYNRYRIRFEQDHVFFDVVDNGRFFNRLAVARFPMQLGRWYALRIDASETLFTLHVDGTLLLRATDSTERFSRGSIAVILWEDIGRCSLDAEFRGMSVSGLR
jgi:hypothetical protein